MPEVTALDPRGPRFSYSQKAGTGDISNQRCHAVSESIRGADLISRPDHRIGEVVFRN